MARRVLPHARDRQRPGAAWSSGRSPRCRRRAPGGPSPRARPGRTAASRRSSREAHDEDDRPAVPDRAVAELRLAERAVCVGRPRPTRRRSGGHRESCRERPREGRARTPQRRGLRRRRPRSATRSRPPGRGSGCRDPVAVGPLGRRVERHERQLRDRLAGPQDDRHAREVGDLERQRAPKARVDEAGGRVDDQPETAEMSCPRSWTQCRRASRGLQRCAQARTRPGGSRTTRRRRSRPSR